MGGIHKKPLSTVDRESRRAEKERLKKFVKVTSEKSEGVKVTVVSGEILNKARDIIKNSRVITPYTIVSKIEGLTYGVAKDVLEMFESEGLIKLVSRNRRISIYVPANVDMKLGA